MAETVGWLLAVIAGTGILYAVFFWQPHICTVVGVERCHQATGRKHGGEVDGPE